MGDQNKRKSHYQKDTLLQLKQVINNYIQDNQPVGGSSDDVFNEFYKSTIYVDKSLFIKEILTRTSHDFISAPQRWGKSLNLSMLRDFLQPDTDKENYKNGKFDFSKGNKHIDIFEKLKIAGERVGDKGQDGVTRQVGIMDKYLGQYPVITLNFSNINGSEYQQIVNQIRISLKKTFKEHEYLLQWMKTNGLDYEHNIFQCYQRGINKYIIDHQEQELQLEEAITFLSEQLFKYFKRKVYVLVDEFDKPVRDLYQFVLLGNNECKTTIKKIVDLLSSIVGAEAKGSSTVKKIVITGILNTFNNNPTDNLNGVSQYNIMNTSLVDYFGFSEEEIRKQILDPIFNAAKMKNTDEKLILYQTLFDQLKFWYNGFNFEQKQGLYNPYSVMSALNGLQLLQQPTVHWASKGVSEILLQIVSLDKLNDFVQKLLLIMKGEYQEEVSFYDYENSLLSHALRQDNSKKDLEQLAFQLLVQNGYITISKNKFCLPGNEQKYIFIKSFLRTYLLQNNAKFSTHEIYSVLEGEQVQFEVFISEFLQKLNKEQLSESQFQAYMFCIFHGNLIVNNLDEREQTLKYHTYLEKHVFNGGKIDTIFFPILLTLEGCVIIHEYKKYENASDLKRRKESALWQIILGSYLRGAQQEKETMRADCQKIKLRGIVFYRSSQSNWIVEVEQREINFSDAIQCQLWIDNYYFQCPKNRKTYYHIKKEICSTLQIKTFDDFISKIKNDKDYKLIHQFQNQNEEQSTFVNARKRSTSQANSEENDQNSEEDFQQQIKLFNKTE